MQLYNIEKIKVNNPNSNIQNLFPDDEVYFYGFKPNTHELQVVSEFIADLNYHTFLSDPISLYLSKKADLYLAELKIFNSIEPVFVSCQSNTMSGIVAKLKMDLKTESAYPIFEDPARYQSIMEIAL